MAYIGKEPADSFISFAKQDFTTSATTSYTLDNAVTNENEIALFINFVRQEELEIKGLKWWEFFLKNRAPGQTGERLNNIFPKEGTKEFAKFIFEIIN